MPDDKDAPRYVTSVAARLAGVAAHTLRAYEKAGLLRPIRTRGGTRLYSQEQVEMAHKIQAYTQQGVNLAGITVLLEMEAQHLDEGKPSGGELK